jgi:putative heme-binding domain-containing protein
MDFVRMAGHIARYGDEKTTEGMVLVARKQRPADLDRQYNLYRAIERGTLDRGKPISAEARKWGTGLAEKLLASKDAGQVQAGITLAGSLRLEGQQERIAAVLQNRQSTEGQLLAAIDALTAIDPSRHVSLLGKVLAGGTDNFKVLQHTANVLARLNQAEARSQLLQALGTAPAPVQTAIAAALAGTPAGAEALLSAVEAGKASPRLLQDRFVEGRLKEARLKDLGKRVAKLTEGLPAADVRIQELMKNRRDGFRTARYDAALGLKVFEKHCANCHQIGGKGARIGPQLDGIGVRGLDRLLEDVLDPNRNVDQAFRTTVLNLKSGQVVSGLFVREEGAVLLLADSQGKEVRVKKGDVEERFTSQLSTMPANLADQIPEVDFHHLMAYLLTQRPPER